MSTIKNPIADKNKQIVLFNVVRGFNAFTLFFESSLAARIRLSKHISYVLIDDGVLSHYDTQHYESWDEKHRHQTFLSKILSKTLLKSSFFIKYSNYISTDRKAEIKSIAKKMIIDNEFQFYNVDLWPHIYSSIVRYYKSAVGYVENEKNYNQTLLRFTENSLCSIEIAKNIFNKIQPNKLVTSHGIYSTWGPFYDFFRSSGVDCITYDFDGFGDEGAEFSKKGLVAAKNDDEFFKKFHKHISLDKSKEISDKIFQTRKQGKSVDIEVLNRPKDDLNTLNIVKELSRGKNVFALFPNVLWDASIIKSNKIFKSQSEWFYLTINEIRKKKDSVLIIKFHPSELSLMTPRVTAKDVIENIIDAEKYDELYVNEGISVFENIILINSDANLSSYNIFDIIDVGLVYNGTIGMELAYYDIPVFVAGDAPYSNKGIFYEFRDQTDFIELLDNPDTIKTYQTKNKDLLFKFINYYFNYYSLPINYIESVRRKTIEKSISNKEILNSDSITYINNCILGDEEYFQSYNLK